ncbi:hypothetical protein DASC09_000960 [Saccharomycopsis crataegensis]|uniref:Uncharacterized protein n=1 Tax=Saccharomycopsis crataegensis TaxID=43959 RepID=A0AAV5QDP5_9ASCO|nr:hypothetical protein DASC09_000960 [Saccharomycopsis crataegensis]
MARKRKLTRAEKLGLPPRVSLRKPRPGEEPPDPNNVQVRLTRLTPGQFDTFTKKIVPKDGKKFPQSSLPEPFKTKDRFLDLFQRISSPNTLENMQKVQHIIDEILPENERSDTEAARNFREKKYNKFAVNVAEGSLAHSRCQRLIPSTVVLDYDLDYVVEKKNER